MKSDSSDGALGCIETGSAASARASHGDWTTVNVISYNFGITQRALESKTWDVQGKVEFLQVLRDFVIDYQAAIVLGCAVGGHKRGPSQTQMDALEQDVLEMKFCQHACAQKGW